MYAIYDFTEGYFPTNAVVNCAVLEGKMFIGWPNNYRSRRACYDTSRRV